MAMVAPRLACSMAITRSCFEPSGRSSGAAGPCPWSSCAGQPPPAATASQPQHRFLARCRSVPEGPATPRLCRLDGRKPALGDAEREGSVRIVTAPDRQRAAYWDLFDQSLGQELADHLVRGAPLQVGRKFNASVLALRGRGQEHKLGIGESHRDLRSVGDGTARRHHRNPALAQEPAGHDPGSASMAPDKPQQ